MKVFITGATGFVGSAVTREMRAHGHEVLGLARSEASAEAVARLGAEPLRGDLADTASLADGVAQADAVIHTGFLHDFSRFAECCALDRAAIAAMGAAIGTASKPFVVTSGVAHLAAKGRTATEADRSNAPSPTYPRASEAAAEALSANAVPTGIMRLPPSVHGAGDHGFVPMLIDFARRTGRSAYIGAGDNRWPAVHVADAARLYRLAVEQGATADTFHAVAEEGVPFRDIAETIAEGLGLPCVSLAEDEAAAHFGGFYPFATIHQPASSAATRGRLGWSPTGPDLLADIRTAGYFEAKAA